MSATEFSRKYAIVGIGATKVGRLPDYSARTMQAEAARLAIEDAGLKRQDIDGAVNAKVEGGGGAAGDWADAFPRILGLPVKFYYHIGRGGALGSYSLVSALSFLEQGIANYVVVACGMDSWSASHIKKRAGGTRPRPGAWGAPFGDVRAVSHHAFFACRHMSDYGTTSRQLGAIAVAERSWACKNPSATMYGRPITVEDHQNSPIFVWPYHILDMSLQSDGGSAFIVTTAERARQCRKPVYILGTGFGEHVREKWWKKANYTALDVQPARENAFRQAGIELKDIDVAQLYDCFTGEVLFQLEDYGWCKKGEGGAFVEAGSIGPGGTIPVNTGGGLLSSHHHADLTGILEGVTQVRGEGGARQQKNVEVCMVTGHGGEMLVGMSSTHTCLVLGK